MWSKGRLFIFLPSIANMAIVVKSSIGYCVVLLSVLVPNLQSAYHHAQSDHLPIDNRKPASTSMKRLRCVMVEVVIPIVLEQKSARIAGWSLGSRSRRKRDGRDCRPSRWILPCVHVLKFWTPLLVLVDSLIVLFC